MFFLFSSKSFIVSGLTCRSLIHFEFISVYGVRKCSSFILLQILEIFPAPLVKEIVFSPLYILASFFKDKETQDFFFFFLPVSAMPSES